MDITRRQFCLGCLATPLISLVPPLRNNQLLQYPRYGYLVIIKYLSPSGPDKIIDHIDSDILELYRSYQDNRTIHIDYGIKLDETVITMTNSSGDIELTVKILDGHSQQKVIEFVLYLASLFTISLITADPFNSWTTLRVLKQAGHKVKIYNKYRHNNSYPT